LLIAGASIVTISPSVTLTTLPVMISPEKDQMDISKKNAVKII